MPDCLILGFNDVNFPEYVTLVRRMGLQSGAFKDLNLAFFEHGGVPYRSLDFLSAAQAEGREPPPPRFHNADFLWPVVSYLGTFLRRRGFSCDFVNLPHLQREQLRQKLEREDVLLIAITTTLYVSAAPILDLMAFIRRHNRSAKVVVGGPFIDNQARQADATALQSLFRYIGADFYVISQEGEQALVNLLTALKAGTSLDEVENLAYTQGDRYVVTRQSIESNELRENVVDYRQFAGHIGQFVSLRTAKSCPFACSFCGFPTRAGKYKYTPVEFVEAELNAVRDLGTVTTVTFLDDTFNVPKGRFKDLLRMMIRNAYPFRWNCFYRADHGDDDVIDLMARAGCERVFLGVESGSDRILQNMNKSARRANYAQAIPRLREVGITAYVSLIVGFPGETPATVRETMDFLEEVQPPYYTSQLWYCDPLTPVWEQRERYGIEGSAFNWSHATMNAETASELIDEMFLNVEHSSWLPQFGFEPWSLSYLERRGMTREAVRTFIRCFNAVIGEKLLEPGRVEPHPDLLRALRQAACFDREPAPDLVRVERLTGARHRAAERFWAEEFHGSSGRPALATLEEPDAGRGAGWAAVPCRLDGHAERVAGLLGSADPVDVLLAAFAALLSRASGEEDVALAGAWDGAEGAVVTPLRLTPAWDSSVADLVGQAARKRAAAEPNAQAGFSLLQSAVRAGEYGLGTPTFDVAFVALREAADVAAAFALQPRVQEGVQLALCVGGVDGGAALVYRRERVAPATVEALAGHLARFVERAAADPGLLVGDVDLAARPAGTAPAAWRDAGDSFQF